MRKGTEAGQCWCIKLSFFLEAVWYVGSITGSWHRKWTFVENRNNNIEK